MFTAEYAGLFDVLLPGLAKRGLPLPLGGSSNHFRAQALRDAGGWDAYNVTEDADLGMRLARFGYDTAVIYSTTLEEAPSAFRHWLPQRTRWFKGWLRTVNDFLSLINSMYWRVYRVACARVATPSQQMSARRARRRAQVSRRQRVRSQSRARVVVCAGRTGAGVAAGCWAAVLRVYR